MIFNWNGRSLEAMPGDTIAMALWRHGIRALGNSRKRHRPLGASGAYVQGSLVQVNGRPHVRAEDTLVEANMNVRAQNVWPSARFDLLSALRFIPAGWMRGGFEHPRFLPGGTRRFELWERLLMFLAGEVSLSPRARPSRVVPKGERWDGDVVVIGGGPEGRHQANAAIAAGESVCLVSRSRRPGSFASALGTALPVLNPGVRLLVEYDAIGIYREGAVVVAAPHDVLKAPQVIATRRVVLAVGRRSIPPLVSGHDLPGVLEARLALRWAPALRSALGPAIVVGTGAEIQVARALSASGVRIAATAGVEDLNHIEGRRAVEGVWLRGSKITCRTLVHAGPWMVDPSLPFQSGASGTLRLVADTLPPRVQVVGDAASNDPPTRIKSLKSLADVAICPCMDVTVQEVSELINAKQTHIEVLKRSTSCGMGPCQGFPCWQHLRAVIESVTGQKYTDHPTYRPPRAGLTVAQAAALDGLLELD